MTLVLYNTLSRKKEKFKPIKKGKVGIYSCGPTVNDIPHLGHAKQQVSFDILRRYFEFIGYKVKFVSNVTDIEDKIISKANELGITIEELTEKNYKLHMEDYRQLNIEIPNVQPRATDYIDKMIQLVEKLKSKGYAYEIEGDGIYFEISKFQNYGELSHQNITSLRKGARSAELKSGAKAGLGKRGQHDFVLWKFSKEGEPKWKSPFGEGRPGWHIECSAMSVDILGKTFDIHCGGQDLVFPHHEDEIAQSKAGYGGEFAHYWIHNGMVNVNGEKMSKSLGNFKTIKDLLEKYDPMVIRYFVISGHYRKPVDFTEQALEDAKNSYDRIKRLTTELGDKNTINKKYIEKFKKEMDDDLNTPRALAILWELLRDKNAKGKYQTVKKIDEVFGLKLLEKIKIDIPNDIKKIAENRLKARKNKDWTKSDELRNELLSKGWIVKDGKDGYTLEKS